MGRSKFRHLDSHDQIRVDTLTVNYFQYVILHSNVSKNRVKSTYEFNILQIKFIQNCLQFDTVLDKRIKSQVGQRKATCIQLRLARPVFCTVLVLVRSVL